MLLKAQLCGRRDRRDSCECSFDIDKSSYLCRWLRKYTEDKRIKERGREIRPEIGQIAKKSYQSALQIEKKEWFNDRLNSQDNEETESVGIGASCDMG